MIYFPHFFSCHFFKFLVCFGLLLPCSGIISMDLQEELPTGVEIFNMREKRQLSPDVKFQVVEQYLSLGGNQRPGNADWVTVDYDSGVVRQNQRVDREKLCMEKLYRTSSDCLIAVKMLYGPKSLLRTESIHFYITDVNDNSPSFRSALLDLSVPETSKIGFGIILDKWQAEDLDKGKNSTIIYSLTPPSEYFSVHQSVDENRYPHLKLVIEKELDFESRKIHRLVLRATDEGSPPLSSTQNIQITVEDRNDNAPIFDQKRYDVTLYENAPNGTDIVVVHATDGDTGARGRIRYRIRDNSAGSEPNLNPSAVPIASRRYPVIVNEITGAVVLRDKLNHKLHDGLKIIIEAVDGDEEDPKIGRALLVLKVDDINDHSPVISVNFITYHRKNTGYVSENAKIGTPLALISATDADAGLNGEITLSAATVAKSAGNVNGSFTASNCVLGLEIGKFVINEGNLLVTGIKFDREKLDHYDVIIRAEDKGVPRKSSTKAITFFILDKNEFAPKFLHSDLVLNLHEDEEIGSVVGTARASDMDSENGAGWRLSENDEIELSSNGKVTYGLTFAEITEDTDDVMPLRIAPKTGQITLTRSLDYETQKTWNLIVTARDGGRNPALQSKCRLTINVLNVNDNAPTFVSPKDDNSTIYASTVSSSQIFTTVKALDFGVDEKTNLKYSFLILERNGNPTFNRALENLFRLNKKTGEFKFDKFAVDESDILGKYKMRLFVTDSGSPPRVSSMTLYVKVVNTPLSGVGEPVKETGKMSTMMIVIIGAAAGGALVFFLLILALVITVKRRKKRKQQGDADDASRSSSVNHSSDEQPPTLTVRTRSVSENSHPRSGKVVEDSGFDSSSTRLTSLNTIQEKSCQYCDVPLSTSERQNFMEIQSSVANNKWSSHSPSTTSPTVIRDAKPVQDSVSDGIDMTSDMGEHCTYMCKSHGHGDSCWMPQEDHPLMPPISPLHNTVAQRHPKPGSYRKDSGCSVDTSSSNLSYCKISRDEKRHKDDVFVLCDSALPDVIAGKTRTLTYSDGSSMMSSNASSGTSRQSKNDIAQNIKGVRLGSLRNSASDSRGDFIRNNYISNQSTRC